MRPSSRSLRRELVKAFLVMAIAGTVSGAVLLVLSEEQLPQGQAVMATASPTASAETAASTSDESTQSADAAAPLNPPAPAGDNPSRVVIPKIGVDAPLVARGVDANGLMQVPDGPEDVAWYEFTGRPGEGANVVLSGHVDYHDYGPAVFWRLRDLTLGDIVEVHVGDGSFYQYVVTDTEAYEAQGAPIEEIVGPTTRETVTLITCDGTFNGASSGYSHRLVVRAERF